MTTDGTNGADGAADDDDDDVVGSALSVGDRLASYREAGVDEFIIRDHRATPVGDAARSLEIVAAELAPQLR